MGVEGESQMTDLVAQEFFLVTPGGLGGHLNQHPAQASCP